MEETPQYRIVKKIGNQSIRKFGFVYLIEDKTTGQQRVMKHLLLNDKNQHLAERLEREATFTFQMFGLPKVIEFQKSERELIYIKEYSNGIPLDIYWNSIPRKHRMSELITILKALYPLFDYLKTQQIVHGDIKPSNILIERKDGVTNCHLIDFGMALRQTEMNEFKLLFPLGFAAPELILNRLTLVNHSTDLYALGITIWKLYTENLPLTHPNPSIFTNLQLTHPLPDHAELPNGLFPILEKMCVKHPFRTAPNLLPLEEVDTHLKHAQSLRYQNITDVVKDLENLTTKRSWWPF